VSRTPTKLTSSYTLSAYQLNFFFLFFSYQPSVPESAMDTLAVHAAAVAVSDLRSILFISSVSDLTCDLENDPR
jgi:hypothetical protein